MSQVSSNKAAPSYGPDAEIANSITHGIGALASIAGLIMLLLRAVRLNEVWTLVAFTIYGTSLALLFLASTLYHSFFHTGIKSVLRVLDHSSIYLLIAGTYTPFTLVSLRGSWGWALFGAIWGLALGGILFKSFYPQRFPSTETVTYVLMGWLSLVALPKLLASLGLGGLLLLIVGGIIYTLGVIFYAWKDLPYSHAIWHLFVLGGATCHYMVVYFFVAPN